MAWAVEQGITKGTSTATFSPGSPCTTAQILTFLWRGAGRPGAASANMAWNDELTAVTVWARSKGITVPSDLNTVCTRSAAATYMWKAAGSPEPRTGASFTDVPANADYAKPVAWAVENGVTDGTGNGAFSPDQGCNRGQIVTFLYREKVEPLKVKTTDPGVNLTMTECNYLRVRESETSYSFSSTRATISSEWSKLHAPNYNNTTTWSVDDPDILELKEMPWQNLNLWVEFIGKKPGSTKITCRMVGEDGYVAEAYCYITFVSR